MLQYVCRQLVLLFPGLTLVQNFSTQILHIDSLCKSCNVIGVTYLWALIHRYEFMLFIQTCKYLRKIYDLIWDAILNDISDNTKFWIGEIEYQNVRTAFEFHRGIGRIAAGTHLKFLKETLAFETLLDLTIIWCIRYRIAPLDHHNSGVAGDNFKSLLKSLSDCQIAQIAKRSYNT